MIIGTFLNTDITFALITALIVFVLCTIGAIINKKVSGWIFGLIVALILIYYNPYLEPIIFGWVGFSDPYLYTISLSLFGIWFVTLGINVYNILKEGVPVL